MTGVGRSPLRSLRRLAPDALSFFRSELVWERDGCDWPHRDASRFVRAGGLRWHVQQLGRGPVVLLLHGTGSATHSWRGLAPLLAKELSVVAPDLPGHGFTEAPPASELSLPGMARALHGLLDVLGRSPALVVGHSAGAAIACRMALDGLVPARLLVGLNAALLPMRGLAGRVSLPVARLILWSSLIPWLLAWRARLPYTVERLLRGTGSHLDAEGIELYRRVARSPRHVASTLGMMAHWDLESLQRDLPGLELPLVLFAGGRDRFVPPADVVRVRELVSPAETLVMPDLGHLAHEERPEPIAELVIRSARDTGLLGTRGAP